MLKIKHHHTDIYLKSILNILTEAYDYVKLTEAVPYSVAKEYLQIERSPEAEARIKEVFGKLKSLPNARQLDKRGYRIAFPYAEDSTEFEIQSVLEPYDFAIKNYKDGVAINKKSNKELSLGTALNIVSKKEPDAKELIDRYAAIKSKGATSKNEDLMMVFSSAKYDIVGMSTGRKLPEFGDWDSCMNVIKGSNKHYVERDIKEGSIICYLTTVSDTNLQRALGRVLIKPYLNTEDEKDVVLYAELKTYGKIPNPEKFIDEVDDYMEKTQKLSGKYERLGCLYDDSERDEIEGKETILTRALKKLEDGEELSKAEFIALPLAAKRKSVDDFIVSKLESYGYFPALMYDFASQGQKKNIIKILIKNKNRINPFIFDGAPKDSKKEIIDYKLDNNVELEGSEFKAATPEQRRKYLDKKIENENFLDNNELDLATEEQREKYFNAIIKNKKRFDKYSYEYSFKYMSQNIKEKYIDSIIYSINLEDYEFAIATEKQKEKHFNWYIQNGYRANDSYIKYMPQDIKENYIEYLIDSDKRLRDYELLIATTEQQIKYIKLIIRGDSYLYDNELMVLSKEAWEEYFNIKSERYLGLSESDLDYISDEKKEKYINLRMKDSKILRNYEYNIATKEQKEKYINWIIKNYSVRYNMILSDNMFKDATPEQKEKYIEKKINNKEELNSFEFIGATPEQRERYIKYAKD